MKRAVSQELPSDPFRMTKDLRLSRCLYCGQPKHDRDALFCTLCGNPIANSCPECSHRNITIARYCEKCGHPTVFFVKHMLPPYGEEPTATFEYHSPPEPPEGYYTREKRRDEESALKSKELDKRLEEFLKEFTEDDDFGEL